MVLLFGVGQQVVYLQIDAVGPSEADDIALIPSSDLYMGGAADYVVFFADGAVEQEVLQDSLRELLRNARGVASESILRKTLYRHPVCGCPSEGKIPLRAGVIVAHGETSVMLEEGEVMVHLYCLLWGCECCPQRVERRDVVIGRGLTGSEVIVIEHTFVRVPKVFVDGGLPSSGAAFPSCGLGGMAEQCGEVGHVALVFIEQAVEAYGRIVVSRAAEWAEAKGGVEAGFTHSPISAIEAAAETVSVDVRVGADFGGGDVTADLCQIGGLGGCGVGRCIDEVAGMNLRVRE